MALDKNEPMAKYNLWQKVPFALVSKLPFYFVASMMADEANCRKMAEAHPKKLSKFWPLETLPLFQLQRETDGRNLNYIIANMAASDLLMYACEPLPFQTNYGRSFLIPVPD